MMIAPAGREEVAAVIPAIASKTLGVHVGWREDARAGDYASAGHGAMSIHTAVGAFDHSAAGDTPSSGDAAIGCHAGGGMQAGVGWQAEEAIESVAAERLAVAARAEAGVADAVAKAAQIVR